MKKSDLRTGMKIYFKDNMIYWVQKTEISLLEILAFHY